jgi:hypothetical protein
MTIEEVEDVIRALIAVAEKLETGAAKQSIREAFMQTRAYADECWQPRVKDRCGNDRPKHDVFRLNSSDVLLRLREGVR